MHHVFEVQETLHPVWLSRRGSGYVLHLGNGAFPVALREDVHGLVLEADGDAVRLVIATHGDEVHIHLDGAAYALRYRHPLDRASEHQLGEGDDCILAPMPGTAVAIHAEVGQRVARGDPLLVMESMKLESTITATRDGIVKTVHVVLGQTFARSAPLVTLETEKASA